MKAKSLYPIIASKNPEKAIEFYRSLGFEIKHDVITKMKTHVYILSNGEQDMEIMQSVNDGFVRIPEGLYGLRMNVDDIHEAADELKEKGATIVVGPFITDNGNKNLLLKDPQGINITLVQHGKRQKEILNEEELEGISGGSPGYAGGMIYTVDQAWNLAVGTEVRVYFYLTMDHIGIFKITGHETRDGRKYTYAGNYCYGPDTMFIFGTVN